ncbi:MAG: glycosyltransferase N-terminal domain-containing protein [Dethiosulfovibrio sp.]|nr:glycosyltransferase N-terminal domain-containing protein [Dethiosulfovibrio sp.]
MSLPVGLYRCAAALAFSVASPWLSRKYSGQGLSERKGIYDRPLIDTLKRRGRPLWVHSVSVGEVQSASPFLRLAKGETKRPLILSTITATGREMAGRILEGVPDRTIYYPWDSPLIVKRALESIRPKAYVTVETEIWPSMIWEMKKRGIPSFMVNGRFSEKTLRSMRKIAPFWRDVLSCYSTIMVRSDFDRDGLMSLGVDGGRIEVTGDCKLDGLMERKGTMDRSELSWISKGQGPLIVAGSTHQGEDQVVIDGFRKVLNHHPDARLIIVPRHPDRAQDVANIAWDTGPVCLYSYPVSGWRTMVVDKIGVLFGLYSLADAAFVGGSLVPKGGQNIMEPAIWGVPFCQGPYNDDFVQATEELFALSVGTPVADSDSMARAFLDDLDPERKRNVSDSCEGYFSGGKEAAKRSWEIVSSCL